MRIKNRWARQKDSLQKNLDLIVYRKRWAVGSLIVLILMGLVFDVWRKGPAPDSGPKTLNREKGLIVLPRCRWHGGSFSWLVVFSSFIYNWGIDDDRSGPNLDRDGTGTALDRAMIDNSKRGSAGGELETLIPQEAKLKPKLNS